jgi:large subunit ribosomal protein L9
VARTEDEAERQARGEDVTVIKEEASTLETFNPDAVFEEEALAQRDGAQDDEDDAKEQPAS